MKTRTPERWSGQGFLIRNEEPNLIASGRRRFGLPQPSQPVYIQNFAQSTTLLIESSEPNFYHRGIRMSQQGFTLWFTGLSGAGKTTLARIVETELRSREHKVEVLDGDVIRTNLSKGLGFSKEDRDTNIRRIGFVCGLLTRNDVVAIAAAISPYREVREELRKRDRLLRRGFREVPDQRAGRARC